MWRVKYPTATLPTLPRMLDTTPSSLIPRFSLILIYEGRDSYWQRVSWVVPEKLLMKVQKGSPPVYKAQQHLIARAIRKLLCASVSLCQKRSVSTKSLFKFKSSELRLAAIALVHHFDHVTMKQSTVQPADAKSNPVDKGGLCLLSLDGGGVRGLLTLHILKRIMDEVNRLRKEKGLPSRLPWEVFDMIGGTSTGG